MGSVPSARPAGALRPVPGPHQARGCSGIWDGRRQRLRAGSAPSASSSDSCETVRRFLLPLVHPRARIDRLLQPRTRPDRIAFYRAHWDNRRWRWLFRTALSPAVVGRFGRDPRFFDYAEGNLSEHLLRRAEHA